MKNSKRRTAALTLVGFAFFVLWTASAATDSIGFLPIDPKPAHSQRRDDMGRKAVMTWPLKLVGQRG